MSANLNLSAEDRAELFGDFDPDTHAAEAERRWGGTQAWADATRRSSSYTKQDWKRFMAEARDIATRLADALRSGIPADSDLAMDLAEEHRAHISRWCYECTYEIHRGLGELYVSDPRFTGSLDATTPGLAAYLHSAITANADRHSS
ncbi:TipAS antibiotic-recognition domain-containing protein [Nonomuraea gerenzanensis]|uniref:Transcriptional regulator, MerR family n=1 Tax=Nonomuraea gerenzanensis TaxID=93944 RepID=A0A1M4EHN5_9ACTN|nr:TipAS antibiotic-recognition domain-containing protein [Nonomuraea gerenzanensis]UBU09808.1 TipAS antibiotic-recognition domain-containing protein [Nonomuraea gerenzanensis]SBO98256.1 transcriptional regulator, MerR family [Nonomuraea gerenzanensis]